MVILILITMISLYTNPTKDNNWKGVLAPLLLILLVSCSQTVYQVSLEGTLITPGLTSYQYGSHQLISIDSVYALRSSSLDLKKYETKEVNIFGQLVDGYPLEGGPALIEVIKVDLLKVKK